MLNTATTILQIKTTDAEISSIETLYITIKQGDFQTAKSNDDIEVDGDVISVTLTKEESQQLKSRGGARVTITAVDASGTLFDVKIKWVKFGSISGQTSGTDGGNIVENNKVWYPTISDGGVMTWEKSETDIPPEPISVKGSPGAPGFSPEITENAENNESIYKLDITSQSGKFTTPNLKGKDGSDGTGSGGFDVLWTNSGSLTANFAAQTIAIENIMQYRFYEVIANAKNLAYTNTVTTGKVPINASAYLQFDEGTTYLERTVNPPTENGVYVGSASRRGHSSISNSTMNYMLVPYMILGYK